MTLPYRLSRPYAVEFVDQAGNVDSAGTPPSYARCLSLIDTVWADTEASEHLASARVFYRGRLQEEWTKP